MKSRSSASPFWQAASIHHMNPYFQSTNGCQYLRMNMVYPQPTLAIFKYCGWLLNPAAVDRFLSHSWGSTILLGVQDFFHLQWNKPLEFDLVYFYNTFCCCQQGQRSWFSQPMLPCRPFGAVWIYWILRNIRV